MVDKRVMTAARYPSGLDLMLAQSVQENQREHVI
jgi:hypothetical protein